MSYYISREKVLSTIAKMDRKIYDYDGGSVYGFANFMLRTQRERQGEYELQEQIIKDQQEQHEQEMLEADIRENFEFEEEEEEKSNSDYDYAEAEFEFEDEVQQRA